ncbi:MAG: DUF2384 domain-containing protein [Parvibaculum sp.]
MLPEIEAIAKIDEEIRRFIDATQRSIPPDEIAANLNRIADPTQDLRETADFLRRAVQLSEEDLDETPVGDALPAATTAEVLGGVTVLGQTVHDAVDLARAVQAGLPAAVLDHLRHAGFSGPEIEDLVAPARTLARRRKDGRLSIEESAATERVARVLVMAARVLGSRDAALGWLRRPLKTRLAGSAPLQYLHSDIGARVVEEILVQAEYGLTA